MPTRLADRLATARRRLFVGRTAEKELFRQALAAAEPPFAVLYIHGPGGVGKTSLLYEFAGMAQQVRATAAYLDARHLDPTPDSFINGLAQALGLSAPADSALESHLGSVHELAQRSGPVVILLDTYEIIAALDAWLRDIFLPQLPANALFVLAGRNPPAAAWRSDPGWQSLVRILPLRNLTPEESAAYLHTRTVTPEDHVHISEFTRGHPLAISLLADVLEQNRERRFEVGATPDIVRTLLERFVQETPSPAHRLALEASALVRQTTEGLLAAMLEMPDVHDIFRWLHELSFMEAGRQGLFPHDLVREALVADLRWRNPDWYSELHKRARDYYMARLQQTQGPSQRRILLDIVFLHRDNFVLRPYFETFFEGQDNTTLWVDRSHAADLPLLLEIVRQHEGDESARLAEHWFIHQPDATVIVRDPQQRAQGLLTIVALHEAPPADLAVDPATQAAWHYLRRHGPLRPGEVAVYFRFWMDRNTYQEMSPVQSRLFLVCLQHYLTTPGLVFTFFCCADPEFWAPIFAYAELDRLTEADFTVGGRTYGVYGHDWRIMTPATWLELMAERELALGVIDNPATAPAAAGGSQNPVLLVLSEPDFADAVRDALRNYTHSSALLSNPLLRSRLVVDAVGNEATPAARIETLQRLLREAVELLQASPRQAKRYRALYHTYLRPAATQELAAELLDVPFSTYRRHLKSGIDDTIEHLWNQELRSGIA